VSLEGTLTDRLREAGVRVVSPRRAIAPNTAANALYCMRTLQELAPDIVHLNGLDGGPILVAALAQGVPIVVHARNAVFSLYEEYCRSAAHVIAVSEFVKRGLSSLGTPDSRITVVYDEADPDWFSPSTVDRSHARHVLDIPDDAFVVGMIARFAPYKRHDVMIRAIEYARARVPNIYLLLKGEVFEYAEQFAMIQAALQAHGLQGWVKWVPFVDDIRLVHSAVDALVLCSDGEALGRCVVEAMSMTVPVDVTSGGGSQEIVAASHGGLVVAPGDPHALGNAIIELETDAGLRERCGRAGREFVRARLTARRSAETVMNLYYRLAGATAKQPVACD
jgi:glycosyltransferase involved in cell wall biosynthesis